MTWRRCEHEKEEVCVYVCDGVSECGCRRGGQGEGEVGTETEHGEGMGFEAVWRCLSVRHNTPHRLSGVCLLLQLERAL